jgi:glycosyltransferase involved in cell wall biosynthesis
VIHDGKKPAVRHWTEIPVFRSGKLWLRRHPSLHRLGLGINYRIQRALQLRPATVMRWLFTASWNAASGFRWLLYEQPGSLSYGQRLERWLLRLFLAIPDAYYRRVFRRLDRAMKERLTPGLAADRSGIAMSIGSLSAGGAERQVMITLRGLHARAPGSVWLDCLHLDKPEYRFFLPELTSVGIPVTRLESAPVEAVPTPIAELILSLPIPLHPALRHAATLLERRPSVAHFWLDDINVKGGVASVLAGVPHIVLSQRNLPPDNFQFHQPHMRETYRWLARQPGVVMINNSQAGAAGYERWLGLPPGTIKVVHNGLEFTDEMLRRYREERGARRARLGIPADAPLVGGVFRLNEEKRPLLWLEVAARVRRQIPDAKFLLLGDGVMRGDVAARAAYSDLAGAVHLPGLDNDSLGAMADMDLLLLTSRIEGLPNVLVEAQAVGTPVVTTAVGGAPETVRHGVTGWVLADADPDHMAQTVVALLRDEAWRKKAAQEAPGFVKAKFNIDRAVDETIALYGEANTEFLFVRNKEA